MARMIRGKGEGAWYGKKIKKLSDTHRKILVILSDGRGLTKKEITHLINKDAKRTRERLTGGFSISGRLSELLGLGVISMKYERVELMDRDTMQFRFMKKPIWRITDYGRELFGKLDIYA